MVLARRGCRGDHMNKNILHKPLGFHCVFEDILVCGAPCFLFPFWFLCLSFPVLFGQIIDMRTIVFSPTLLGGIHFLCSSWLMVWGEVVDISASIRTECSRFFYTLKNFSATFAGMCIGFSHGLFISPFDYDMDIPMPQAVAGYGGRGGVAPRQKMALVVADLKSVTSSAFQGGKGNAPIFFPEREDPGIVVDAGGTKDWIPFGLESSRYSGNGPDGQVGGQACLLAKTLVGSLLEPELVGGAKLVGHGYDAVASIRKGLHGLHKGFVTFKLALNR